MKEEMRRITTINQLPFYNCVYVGNVFLGIAKGGLFGKVEFLSSSFFESFTGIKLTLFSIKEVIDTTEILFDNILGFNADFESDRGEPYWNWKSNDRDITSEYIEKEISKAIYDYFSFFINEV